MQLSETNTGSFTNFCGCLISKLIFSSLKCLQVVCFLIHQSTEVWEFSCSIYLLFSIFFLPFCVVIYCGFSIYLGTISFAKQNKNTQKNGNTERSVLLAQSSMTLCNPVDCNPPGSSVQGEESLLQARILEWVAISFSTERRRNC